MFKSKKLMFGIVLIVATGISCAKKKDDKKDQNKNPVDLSDDSIVYSFESSIVSINSALNEVEKSVELSRNQKTFDLIQKSYASDSCDKSRFDPPIGKGDCSGTVDNKTVTAKYDGCLIGKKKDTTLHGKQLLTFDSVATCVAWNLGDASPDKGSVTVTSSGLTKKYPDERIIHTSTDSKNNYRNEGVGGGTLVVFNSFEDSSKNKIDEKIVTILGLTKSRRRGDGKYGFEHSVRTKAPIIVRGSRLAGTAEVASGEVVVDHNKSAYTLVGSIGTAGLKYADIKCCHPNSGKIKFTATGSKTGEVIVDFESGVCGEVLMVVVDENGKETKNTISLAACE